MTKVDDTSRLDTEEDLQSLIFHARDELAQQFKDHAWDPQKSYENLAQIVENRFGFPFDLSLHSVHWLLFSALSQVGIQGPILEIGTHRGEATRLLSELFPETKITTIDLPGDDPGDLKDIDMAQQIEREHFVAARERNLDHPNIRFIECNSFYLPDLGLPPAGLIWVDEDHHYPQVAWDISNALRQLLPGGYLFCDDIEFGPRDDEMFTNVAGGQIVTHLRDHLGYEVSLFPKRLNAVSLLNGRQKCKYVAMIRNDSRGSKAQAP